MIKIKYTILCAAFMPLLMLLMVSIVTLDKGKAKSEKYLVNMAKNRPVFFLERKPTFSARFYSQERVSSITLDELHHRLTTQAVLLILKKQQLNTLMNDKKIQVENISKSKKFILASLSAH